jgi:hypothetical protein
MSTVGYDIAASYAKGERVGWGETHNPGLAKSSFNLLWDQGVFQQFKIAGQSAVTSGRKMFLHEIVRAVLGHDTENYPQEVSDCTSFGAKNAVEYLTCAEIAGKALMQQFRGGSFGDTVKAARLKWRPVFPPFFYGVGRVLVGGRSLRGDGAMGSWMTAAAMKYGALFSDDAGVPRYSGSVAKDWGDDQQGFQQFLALALSYLLGSAARIDTWEDLCAAIVNGYPCTTASDIGYSMEAGRDGFHVQNASWSHQMCITGIDETYNNDPYGLILNNWGDVHGHLKDFQDGSDLPKGVIRARRKDIEKHLRAGETFAWSRFNGFPEQKLDKALFMLI